MRSKFNFLFKQSLKKKMCTKWFKWVNVILLIVLVCLTNIDSIIKFFGGDFDEPINMYVYDESNVYDDLNSVIKSSYTSVLESYNLVINKLDGDVDKKIEEIKNDESSDIVLKIIPSNNYFDAEIISYDYIDSVLLQDINASLNTVKKQRALVDSGIDLALLESVNKDVNIRRTILNEDLDEDSEFMQMIGSVLIIVFILPFFFLIIMIVQMIGAEINEEKSSKSMELIISSVSPKVHFFSKMASANVFAICQSALLIVYVFVGAFIRVLWTGSTSIDVPSMGSGSLGNISEFVVKFLNSDILQTIIKGIPLFLIITLLSFILYSLFTGVLASMTTSMEDYQQLQSPIMIFLMIGYYLAIMSTLYDGSSVIKVISFIPFISGILSPVLYTLGELTLFDLWINVGIMAVTIVVLYKYGMKVYKVGILNYSSNKLWKKIFKSLKN